MPKQKESSPPYAVEFKTGEVPGKIQAFTVKLGVHYFGMDERVRVDLCDHPLYPALEAYVHANPSADWMSGKRRGEKS